MSARQFLLILVPFLLLIALGIFLYPREAPIHSEPEEPRAREVCSFAMVGNDTAVMEKELEPFLAFINRFLEKDGVELRPVVYSTPQAIEAAIELDKVDFYLDSPIAVYEMSREGRLHAVARQWKNGTAEYHSVIVARRDNPARLLSDIGQMTIAFEDVGSTSSYYMPAADLTTAGYQLVPADSKDPSSAADTTVYFLFSNWDDTSLEWVLSGEVDLAALNSTFIEELDPVMRQKLRVIHKTNDVPRHLVAVRPGLAPDVEDAVVSVLMDMENSTEGRQILDAFYKTRRFDLIPYESDLRQQILAKLDRFPWRR